MFFFASHSLSITHIGDAIKIEENAPENIPTINGKVKSLIDGLQEKVSSKENDLYMYKTLNKDLKKYNEHFDEMTYIKESTSSKKGMYTPSSNRWGGVNQT